MWAWFGDSGVGFYRIFCVWFGVYGLYESEGFGDFDQASNIHTISDCLPHDLCTRCYLPICYWQYQVQFFKRIWNKVQQKFFVFFFFFFLGNLLSLMAVKFYYGFWFFRRMWGQYWIFLFIWNLIEVFYFYFYKILIIVGQFILLYLFGHFTITTWLCFFFVDFHHYKLLLPFLS